MMKGKQGKIIMYGKKKYNKKRQATRWQLYVIYTARDDEAVNICICVWVYHVYCVYCHSSTADNSE